MYGYKFLVQWQNSFPPTDNKKYGKNGKNGRRTHASLYE